MVKLKNKGRRLLHFNLEAQPFLDDPGQNGIGEPESVTFLPFELKELPDAALECVEIKAALTEVGGRPSLLKQV